MREVTCFQSSLYTNLTDQLICDKLEDEHRFQYHKYGVCLHFRGTDITILPTRTVTAGQLKNLHHRLPLILVKLPT